MARVTADMMDVVRRLRWETPAVVCGFSCGKDSAACLDLCYRWFDRVAVYYLYYTPNLSFHESYLAWVEKRYADKLVGGKVYRLPHWGLSTTLQGAVLRPEELGSWDVPRLRIRDTEVYMAKETGIGWFVSGQKKADSLERRAMLNKANGIMFESHRAFPLAEWSDRTVTQYLRQRDIPLSPEYQFMGTSYGGHLAGDKLVVLRDHFPADYERVLRRFPFAEAEVFRHESGMNAKPKKERKPKAAKKPKADKDPTTTGRPVGSRRRKKA